MKRRLLVAVAVAALLLVGGGAWLARAEEGRLPPAVAVGGVSVGGRSVEDAGLLLRRAARRRAHRPIVLTLAEKRIEISGALLGAEPELDRALTRARRSRGAFSRLAARIGFAGTSEVPLTFRLDPARLAAFLDVVGQRVDRPASPARLEFRGQELIVVPSQAGRTVDARALEARLMLLPSSLRLPLRPLSPPILEPAARRARARAEKLLRNPPAVVLGRMRAQLGESLLRRALRFEPRGRKLLVSLAPAPLAARLRPAFRDYEAKPRDARFRVHGDRVELVPATRGRELAVDRIAADLVEQAGSPEVRARFDTLIPELTTAKAKALGIRELVSEFTTNYPCCAPRVANIQRAARILDGTIVPAGGRFSLNEGLGMRTPDRGFVTAPMIARGRLIDAVGGGVSQVATTFYNAAFFAGLELVTHTPHQFYISRYPVGREATVSWGGPELIFRNNWPAAILVKVEAGSTSITVRFYSSLLGRRVETETGKPYNWRAARVRTVLKRSLPRGSRTIVQHGGVAGFSVSYTRRVFRGEKLIKNERFYVRYDPEDTVIEVGPPKRRNRKHLGDSKRPGNKETPVEQGLSENADRLARPTPGPRAERPSEEPAPTPLPARR